ncbi:hypothetical protein QE429_000864 [Bacillus sp. SORGH_AS 510]|nr:hypothetical protein [Bacillus sp. SORGH_AS_0510]
MKWAFKYSIILIAVFIVRCIFDYTKNHTFSWTENIIQSASFVALYGFFSWLFESKRR